jgi:hypothetical protein
LGNIESPQIVEVSNCAISIVPSSTKQPQIIVYNPMAWRVSSTRRCSWRCYQ